MKKLAIVSNKPQKDDRFAAAIDNCDEVLRFSSCIGWGSFYGEKITIWTNRTEACGKGLKLVTKYSDMVSKIAEEVHTIFVVHSFGKPEHGVKGGFAEVQKLDHIAPFRDTELRKVFEDWSKIVPIDVTSLMLICPHNQPSTGLCLLHHILVAGLFSEYDKLLFGFDFEHVTPMARKHRPKWEASVVAQWVRQGAFKIGTRI